MEQDEHRKSLLEFIETATEKYQPVGGSMAILNDLDHALYAFSECGLWPDDIDSISMPQALMIWRLVERLRHERFPAELRM